MSVDTGRKQAGRFKPGQSGNPAGRPRGTRNKATVIAQALLEGEAEALSRKAVELTLEGDMAAIRLCLERLVPVARESTLPEDAVPLPKTSTAKSLPKAMGQVLQAVASGSLTPGQGEKLTAMLTAHGKLLELAEIEARLTELERRAEEVKNGKNQ